MRVVSVLGSTGSIGAQALDVIRNDPELRVGALAAGSTWNVALQQAKEFGARLLALQDPGAAAMARKRKDQWGMDGLQVVSGPGGLEMAARFPDADVVLHAIPGFAGIRPLLASLEKGKRVAFAGKEALVSAGELFKPYINAGRDRFIPVDSEHSAIFQCLVGEDFLTVDELVLTASGGALRDWALEDMAGVAPAQVLRHPTWRMGKKVTVDSATLFNKTLEVMEAHYLFSIEYSKIRVVIHKESIVHSMVTFKDGSTKAQAARPDMKLAISYGMTYPGRVQGAVDSLAPYTGILTFEKPDTDRFPSLLLGYRAGDMGGTAPCALSWADEILVGEFLGGRIGFLDIYLVLREFIDGYSPKASYDIEILEAERDIVTATIRELLELRGR